MTLHCIDALREDHREVAKALLELEGLIDEFLVTDEVPGESRRALRGIAEFLERELFLHLQKEDQILFPVLAKVLSAEPGALLAVRDQHERISEFCRGLLEGVAHLQCCPSTRGFGATQVRDHGRALIEELRAHLSDEERLLFPLAESCLTDEHDKRILQKSEELATIASHARANA